MSNETKSRKADTISRGFFLFCLFLGGGKKKDNGFLRDLLPKTLNLRKSVTDQFAKVISSEDTVEPVESVMCLSMQLFAQVVFVCFKVVGFPLSWEVTVRKLRIFSAKYVFSDNLIG